MKQFAQLIEELEDTPKDDGKIDCLKRYFQQAPESDRVWTIALLINRRPKRQVHIRMLVEWARQVAALEEWLFRESKDVVGDLAETIALILPKQHKVYPDRSLKEWVLFLVEMTDKNEGEKEALVKQAWLELPEGERFVFNKLITGGFRIGVSQNLMVKALAEQYDLNTADVTYALSGEWDPMSISFSELLFQRKEVAISRPYPFQITDPIDMEVHNLREPDDWSVEWSWDGIRSQLIIREGNLFLWSRNENLLTEKFPELRPLVELLPDGTVIDGELVPFKDGVPLSFHLLKTRIGRKNVTKKLLKEVPASILAYDLLEFEGQDIRQLSLKERRKMLSRLIKQSLAEPMLQYSDSIKWSSWSDLEVLRAQSRAHHAKGFVIKGKESSYQSGEKQGGWWKWKVDPYTVDAVMIYAQKGQGERADFYSDCTFAVWQGETLVPFAKARWGLTDKELHEVTQFVQKNTLEKFGPVRTVNPTLVFEIHFEGINLSPRHKSGVAVRFPKVHGWKRDKSAKEANTIDDLMILLK